MIIGIVSACHRSVSVLFDLGSTFSIMSTYFTIGFDMTPDCIHGPIHVSTLVGEFLVVDRVDQFCLVFFC